MKKSFLLIIMSVILVSSGLFASGQQESAKTPETSESTETTEPAPDVVTIVDSKGRSVSITQPVRKIAFSHYAIGDGLKILNAWNLVVAKDGFSSDKVLFPGIDKLPPIAKAGSPYSLNYEELYELEPDILVTSDLPLPGFDDMVKKLGTDIPVVALDLQNPDTLTENLLKLGKLLGREEEAQEYIEWYNNLITNLSEKTAKLSDDEKTRILQRTGMSGNLMTFTDDYSGIKLRNRITGSINVAGTLPSKGGWVQSMDPEWIAVQDIDVIVNFDIVPRANGTGVDDEGSYKKYRDDLMAEPVFANTNAVKKGRFYMIANEFWGTMRNIIGFAYMAKWCHPELFKDFDPEQVHQEYLTRFMRVDYDLDKHGVFVYPKE
ncbi:MAG: ABC transporter substrate-binding protein [Spirochaetales bacterium]|nr:ABC transporter substrate-binding protein [Spirochaetales bacterium]